MKFAVLLSFLSCAMVASGQSCMHAYSCSEPLVTVAKLSDAEMAQIKAADEKAAKAAADAVAVRDKVIEAHGGYVLPNTPYGGMIESGHRLSDEAIWREPFLILTKEWTPEL
jgi:hypothetical protein